MADERPFTPGVPAASVDPKLPTERDFTKPAEKPVTSDVVLRAPGRAIPAPPPRPQGPRGEPGPQGAQGVQGPAGTQGTAGTPGPQGIQGPQGFQGPPGEQGERGEQGDRGSPGIQGPAGVQGAQGIQGLQGPPGDEGAAGPQGDQGAPGPAGAQGIQGVQGLQGPAGVQGPPGDEGPIGPAGDAGPPGIQGLQGIQGARGLQGPPGDEGPKGDDGEAGPRGATGATGATGTAGLRVNGATAPVRGFWNYLNTVDGTWATVDDAGNNESELRFTPLGSFYSDNSVGSIQTRFVSFDDSADLTAVVTDNTGGSGFVNVTFTLKTDAVGNTELANMAANTIKANPTAGSADPQDLAISADSFPARLSGNLVSHPLATLAGAGLDYASGGVLNVAVDNDRDIQIDDSTGALFYSKSRNRHWWFEDFDVGMVTGQLSATSGNNTLAPAANGNWFLGGVGGTAGLEPQLPANNHPGIWRLSSPPTTGLGGLLHRGLNEIRFDEVGAFEAIMAVPTVTTIGWTLGVSDSSLAAASNFIGFVGDTTTFGSTNIQARTTEASTATTTDTGVTFAAGAWNVYTIIQETLGTVEFYIDDVLEATHTTNVPDSETGGVSFLVYPRTNASRTLDIDYVSLQSRGLGTRTS